MRSMAKKDFPGLPLLRVQQGFQVACRLVQVQNQCMENVGHDAGFLKDNRVRGQGSAACDRVLQ